MDYGLSHIDRLDEIRNKEIYTTLGCSKHPPRQLIRIVIFGEVVRKILTLARVAPIPRRSGTTTTTHIVTRIAIKI